MYIPLLFENIIGTLNSFGTTETTLDIFFELYDISISAFVRAFFFIYILFFFGNVKLV